MHGSQKDVVKNAIRISEKPNKFSANLEYDQVSRFAHQDRFFDLSESALDDPESLIDKIKELKEKGATIILDIDFDIFTRDSAIPLFNILSKLQQQADVCTCATSPYYFDQNKSMALAKNFISDCLSFEKE